MYKSSWGVAGGLYGTLILLSSTLLYRGFSLIKQPLSDLGWGDHPCSILIFRIGVPTLAIPLIPYILFLDRTLSETKRCDRLRKLAFACSLACLGGLWTVTVFNDPRTDYFYFHTFGGAILFVFGCVLVGLYSLALVLSRTLVHKFQMCWSGLCVLLGICLLANTFPVILEHDVFGLLASLRNASTVTQRQYIEERITEKAKWFPLVEWMFCYALCLWFYITGVCTYSIEKKKEDGVVFVVGGNNSNN